MSDRPLIGDTSAARAETRVLTGIVYAALVALLIVLGARMFIPGDTNLDASTAQPGTEALVPG